MKGKKVLFGMVILMLLISMNNLSALMIYKDHWNNDRFLDHNRISLFSHLPPIFSLSPLKPGDIAFKHPEAFRGPVIIDHCLLCTEYDNETDTYTFIEAHFHHGVQYRYEKRENLSRLSWGPFARIKGVNDTQIQNAISFARQQIGKEFQIEWVNKNHNPTDLLNDTLANEWYCSELIWASYYNCNHFFDDGINETEYIYGDGIDIDVNGWTPIFNHTIVAPREIIIDNDVQRLLFPFRFVL